MFERNKVDNSQHQIGVAVEITHADGRVEKGKLLVAVSSKVVELLNGPQLFLEFESYDGERTLIAKSALAGVRVVNLPAAANLAGRLRDGEFDPYRVLGLEPGAGWEAVKAAYHAAAKSYHPDRYANAELPPEVRDYLAAMVRRINAAYAALEPQNQIKRELSRHKTEPVYSSPGR